MIGAVKASQSGVAGCDDVKRRVVSDHPQAPDHLISRLSAPDVSQAELLLAVSPSRGETNHPLFLSIFRDFDD